MKGVYQNAIFRPHKVGMPDYIPVYDWAGRVKEHKAVWNKPVQWEILGYVEGWGYVPINGSGDKTKSEIPEGEKRPIYLCTEAEHREFTRLNFPATWEHMQEQENASLQSAMI